MTGHRYDVMFGALRRRGEVALIPFLTLGDPDPASSERLLEAVVTAGADALELGLPFSDPVADGPVIQAAASRALVGGATRAGGWELLARVRRRHPDLPIGLLVYANLTIRPGLDCFYQEAAAAGADSVLVADLPIDEAAPWVAAATRAGLAPVFIVPPNADPNRIDRIARQTRGYTYVTTRAGVTGEDHREHHDLAARLSFIAAAGGPPAVLGFGISTPEQVRSAVAAGAGGVIVGSALARRIDASDCDGAAVAELVRVLKAATRSTRPPARSAN
jgi:tryptophan synthase alpha chain